MPGDEPDVLWSRLLAEVERIKTEECRGHGATQRGIGMYAPDGGSASTIFQADMPGGMTRVFHITAYRSGSLRVDRWFDHSEDFWQEQIAHPEGSIRIDGVHYRVGPRSDRPGPFNGFGGHKHTIEFLDGRQIVTYDLWTQGSVPDPFRHLLPDNARFVSESQS